MLRLSQLITSLVRTRREVRTMASLDDRALADIGLLRSDVSSALEPWTSDTSTRLKTLCCQWRRAAVPQGCR